MCWARESVSFFYPPKSHQPTFFGAERPFLVYCLVDPRCPWSSVLVLCVSVMVPGLPFLSFTWGRPLALHCPCIALPQSSFLALSLPYLSVPCHALSLPCLVLSLPCLVFAFSCLPLALAFPFLALALALALALIPEP